VPKNAPEKKISQPNMQPPEHKKQAPHPVFDWRPILLTLVTLFIYLNAMQSGTLKVEDVPYSSFKDMVTLDTISSVVFEGKNLTASKTAKNAKGKALKLRTILPDIDDTSLLPLLEKHNVEVSAKSGEPAIWLSVLLNIIPWILIFGIFAYSNRMLQSRMGGGANPMNFFKSKARLYQKVDVHIGFDEVAGLESAKTDLREVIEYLTRPEKFRKLGAKLPRGILMMGPPGTGKTLLAKAMLLKHPERKSYKSWA